MGNCASGSVLALIPASPLRETSLATGKGNILTRSVIFLTFLTLALSKKSFRNYADA